MEVREKLKESTEPGRLEKTQCYHPEGPQRMIISGIEEDDDDEGPQRVKISGIEEDDDDEVPQRVKISGIEEDDDDEGPQWMKICGIEEDDAVFGRVGDGQGRRHLQS
ncbi:hypothetical protein PoB_001669700 [Plakobranchus ocellatus]|uniref:Uncharacterized protein n=1 Tax=Plakobranchus ocellatus TaxID=259542 RepID=A0AAV3Z6P4_9GAST|nr:hypothetical protein PoB_001669700 [Plakobranchus ocellatus]